MKKKLLILLMALFTLNTVFSAETTAFIPAAALRTKYISSGVSAYYDGSLWGLYDDKGIILYPTYSSIENKSGTIIASKNKKYGTIDIYGRVIIPFDYDYIYSSGTIYLKVKKNGYYGLVDNSGKILQQSIYTYLESISKLMYSVCNETGCGIIKADGTTIIPLNYFAPVSEISGTNSFYKIKYDDGYSIIDIYGRNVSNAKYETIEKMDHNVIYFTSNKFKGLARIYDGTIIAQPIYQKIEDMSQKGFYKVKKNNKWGAIGYDGAQAYACEYGPFEINRLMNKYPSGNEFQNVDNYNYYYSKLLELYFYILYSGKYSSNTKEVLNEILEDKNINNDLKIEAKKLMN